MEEKILMTLWLMFPSHPRTCQSTTAACTHIHPLNDIFFFFTILQLHILLYIWAVKMNLKWKMCVFLHRSGQVLCLVSRLGQSWSQKCLFSLRCSYFCYFRSFSHTCFFFSASLNTNKRGNEREVLKPHDILLYRWEKWKYWQHQVHICLLGKIFFYIYNLTYFTLIAYIHVYWLMIGHVCVCLFDILSDI